MILYRIDRRVLLSRILKAEIVHRQNTYGEGAMNASEVLVERLIDWEVEYVFGLPGDGINGIMEALRTRQDKTRFIQVRHEESAAFMACGYAKYTGKVGVCVATSGPGGIHILNGLYDAKLDHQPLPHKITADQALHFAESLAKGEPNRGKIVLTAVLEKVRELI
jgi:2-succinyl-5-enolpyruvyl-6-hydroxy-3-cyclohexene-1-carboxylate synthase